MRTPPILAKLVIPALSVALLAGCSSSGEKDAAPAGVPSASQEPSPGVALIPAEVNPDGTVSDDLVPALEPGATIRKKIANPVPTKKSSNAEEEVGYGHSAPDASRTPSELGLPDSGIPGRYLGAVPESPKSTSYRFALDPVKTRSEAKRSALQLLSQIEDLLTNDGWAPASDRSPVTTEEFGPGTVPIDAQVSRLFIKDGLLVTAIVYRSVVKFEDYNLVILVGSAVPKLIGPSPTPSATN